ncbi:MAG: sulfite exporter TauE/SafE family protein [Bacteroidetes bacterium]|nr:sulfite exporter TauE/SafE family protein [Bacteroidota bacterium]
MEEYVYPIILLLVGVIAGFINTIAGGASLIILPILIFMGLPPNVANGTNRIAIFVQTIFSTAGFKSKKVDAMPFSLYIGLAALVGAIIGAQLAVDIPPVVFNRTLSVIMILVGALLFYKPKLSLEALGERTSGKYLSISLLLFFVIGIYAGFLQAGAGIFIILTLNLVNRFTLVKSNAAKSIVIFILTLGALTVFVINDVVNWKYGLILALGNAFGAWFSSRWSVQKGDRVVRLFLVGMIGVMAIKLWFF